MQGKNDHLRVVFTLIAWVFFTLTVYSPNKQRPSGMARVLLKPRELKANSIPGVLMKKVVQPLAWFVVLTSVLAVASGISLGLV
jgi:hypothetical protein